MQPGDWIRAARRTRKVSQRELAELSGVPSATIAKAECNARTPRIETFVRLMAALGYELIVIDHRGRVLTIDEEHDRLRDRGGRRFPAHLIWGRTPSMGNPSDLRDWWGYFRIAWNERDPVVPKYTYWWRRTYEPVAELRARLGEKYWEDVT